MFNIAKFFGGFAFWQGDKLGKILYVFVIVLVCLGVFWKLFLAPTNIDKSSQRARTITNITQEQERKDDIFIGIKLWALKLGISVK